MAEGICRGLKGRRRQRQLIDLSLYFPIIHNISVPHTACGGVSGAGCGRTKEKGHWSVHLRCPLPQKGACDYAARGREAFHPSTSSSNHATRQAPRSTRLGNCPAFSRRAMCANEYGIPWMVFSSFFETSFLTCVIDISVRSVDAHG
jgi:hypothetical protein